MRLTRKLFPMVVVGFRFQQGVRMNNLEYIIYSPGSTEDVGASFHSPEFIPHIAPGNYLQPLIGGFEPSQTGHHLRVTNVETYLFSPISNPDPLLKITVHVFTEEVDRAHLAQ